MLENKEASKSKPTCGIVMPISSIDGCAEDHWAEVLDILSSSISDAGFEPNLVSSSEDIGVIQKRIIQNLYDNPIVVVDVSAKNPNVMFELGLRLAFDKPTIIVKDDKTSYSFDTSPIEHLTYPRDLSFSDIVRFKLKLAEKIQNTIKKANSDASYTPFLGHFGTFKVAKIDKKEVSGDEFIIDQLRDIRLAISSLRSSNRSNINFPISGFENERNIDEFAKKAKRSIRKYMRENSVDMSQIHDKFDEVARIVEREADAPSHFSSPTDFEQYLRMLLTAI